MVWFSKLRKKSTRPGPANATNLNSHQIDEEPPPYSSIVATNADQLRPATPQPEITPESVAIAKLHEAGFHSDTVREDKEPLWWACTKNEPLVVEYLVNRKPPHPFLNDEHSNYGRTTPLQYAIEKRYMKTAIVLLRNGADSPGKDTLLDSAARYGTEPELLDLMLRRWFPSDSPIGIADSHWGSNAFFAAIYGARNGLITCVPFLWENGCAAVVKSNWSFGLEVKKTLDTPGAPTSIQKYIRTSGIEELARPGIQRTEFNTSVHHPATESLQVTKRLLAEGWQINDEEFNTSHGSTPLHAACKARNVQVATLLCEHGADVNVSTNRDHHETSLIIAAKHGGVDLLNLLLNYGAQIDACDLRGWTALHWACRNNRTEAVRLLLEHGADTELKNKDGKLPFDLVPKPEILAEIKSIQASSKAPASTMNTKDIYAHNAKLNDRSIYTDAEVLRWD